MNLKIYLIMSILPLSFFIGYMGVILSDTTLLTYFLKNIFTISLFAGITLFEFFSFLIFKKR